MNQEAGQTQQRQVTETIVERCQKINHVCNLIQNVDNGQTQEMKFKKAET
jgi:preprotein translocase subunit SecA